jgi:hypothetical protein
MGYKSIGFALFFCLVGNLGGCTLPDKISIPIRILNIEQGYHSSIRESLERVIRTQDEWDALWKQHGSTRVDLQPFSYDFIRGFIIAVFLGGRADGRYSVQITRIAREATHITVTYQEVIVGKNCTYVAAPTHPYHAVYVLERIDLPVQFHKQTTSYDCTDPTPFETIARDSVSSTRSIWESSEQVIRTLSEWEGFWEKFTGVDNPSAPPPLQVADFTHESIIAIFTGGRGEGGYCAEITGIVRDSNRLIVIYSEVVTRDAGVLLVATQPFHIVKLKRIDQPVLFHRQTEIRNCSQ